MRMRTTVIPIASVVTSSEQGQAGRYQLLSAQHTWVSTDKDHKAVLTEEMDLFRIDTVTGETDVLMPATDANGPLHSMWMPVAKPPAAPAEPEDRHPEQRPLPR